MGTGWIIWVFWEDGRTWVMSVGLWEGKDGKWSAREKGGSQGPCGLKGQRKRNEQKHPGDFFPQNHR